MSNKDRVALVPKLRFPEFRGTGEWRCGSLASTLSAISNGLAIDQGSDATGYKVTRIETISSGDIDLGKIGFVKPSHDISAYKLQVGDILFSNINSVSHVGKSVIVERDYDLYHGMNLLRLCVDRKKHAPLFIYYAINTDRVRASFRERANKAVNQASINQTELGKTEVALPLFTEQQKIADCLSSLDELIVAQARKVNALKTHKKGLMQQLFPREGETQPRLRFPEFQNAEEWQRTSLGGVARLRNGYAFKSAEYVDDGPHQIITIANVQQGGLSIESTRRMAALPPDIQQHQVLSLGDILISMTGNVGRVCRVTVEGLLLNQRVGKLTPEKIDADFFYQLLQRDEFRNTMQLKAAGGAQGNLSSGDITDYVFSAPAETDEQLRIATCLSSLDALVTAATQELEALKIHKKGLMQQLFPSAEDVA